jgi:O-antigen ligase
LNSPAPRLLFWTLVLALACPIRADLRIGPFATLSVVDLAVAMCGAYLALRFATLGAIRVGPPSLLVAVFGPAFLALASMLWTLDAERTFATTIKYFYAALVYLAAMQFSGDLGYRDLARASLVILVGWLLGSAAMYAGVPGFDYFISQSAGLSEEDNIILFASIYTRLGHPYVGQSNDYGPLLALLGFVLLGCARPAASFLAFFSSLLTFSRGLMLGLLASLALYAWLSRTPFRRVAALGGVAAVLLGVLAFAATELTVRVGEREIDAAELVESRLSDANVATRLEGYAETWRLILERPWLGYGAGYFDRSRPDTLAAAHNAFLEQWKYFGLALGTLSIGCYLLVAGYFFSMRHGSPAPAFFDAIACAFLFLLMTAMAQTFYEATTPRAFIYFVLGLCVRAPGDSSGQAKARAER